MTLAPPIRALLVGVAALTYLAAAFWVAGTGAIEALAPLSRAMTVAIPLGAGLLCALAPSRSHLGLAILAAILVVALGGSAAISAGWLPIAWFAFAGAWVGAAVLAGAIGGSFVADRRFGTVIVALIAIALPFVVLLEPAHERASDEEVTTRVEVLAPSQELWEEVIGADSIGVLPHDSLVVRADEPALVAVSIEMPRLGELRHLVFSDSSSQVERIAEWEDAERLRVASGPRVLVPPRGMAAWRAGWGKGAVLQTAALYELVARGDTTTLTISSRYRMHLHPRAYPQEWVARVAAARSDALAAAFRVRAERRAGLSAELTAEMRAIRAALFEEANRRAERDQVLSASPLFVNGDRALELVDEPPAGPSPSDTALRASLRRVADRARTTGFLHIPRGDSASLGGPATVEFEDYLGRCVREHIGMRLDAKGGVTVTAPPPGAQALERCTLDVMARRAQRSRLIAELPLSAGEAGDHWSIPLIVRGITRVYLDSIVVRADTIRFKATPSDGQPQQVDSIGFGLSQKTERAWFLSRRGTSITLGQTFAKDAEWSRTRVRFSVAADSSVDLNVHWPTFQAVISVPKTESNPYGTAWTYSHAPMAYFNGVRRE